MSGQSRKSRERSEARCIHKIWNPNGKENSQTYSVVSQTASGRRRVPQEHIFEHEEDVLRLTLNIWHLIGRKILPLFCLDGTLHIRHITCTLQRRLDTRVFTAQTYANREAKRTTGTSLKGGEYALQATPTHSLSQHSPNPWLMSMTSQ